MPAFFISAAFGCFQVLMLKFALGALTGGKKAMALIFFLVKFFAYGVAIALLMLKYFSQFSNCAFGFIAGMPFFAIILFAWSALRKKDR